MGGEGYLNCATKGMMGAHFEYTVQSMVEIYDEEANDLQPANENLQFNLPRSGCSLRGVHERAVRTITISVNVSRHMWQP